MFSRHRRRIAAVIGASVLGPALLMQPTHAFYNPGYCGHGIWNVSSTQRLVYSHYYNVVQPGDDAHVHNYQHQTWQYRGPGPGWGWVWDHSGENICGTPH